MAVLKRTIRSVKESILPGGRKRQIAVLLDFLEPAQITGIGVPTADDNLDPHMTAHVRIEAGRMGRVTVYEAEAEAYAQLQNAQAGNFIAAEGNALENGGFRAYKIYLGATLDEVIQKMSAVAKPAPKLGATAPVASTVAQVSPAQAGTTGSAPAGSGTSKAANAGNKSSAKA